MGRFPSHKGHVILPVGEGWYVPDFQDPSEGPVTVQAAKRLIDSREAAGEPPREPSEVAWDAAIVGTTGQGIGINVGQAAAVIKAGRGDTVRVILKKK